jgi:glucose 1-dehydrogenase
MKLDGKTAIVTGASRGIGRAVAIALAEAGADVGINFHSHEDEAREVAAAVEQHGRRAVLLQGDVADLATVEAMIEQVVAELGGLDIAVSNSAFSVREPFFEANMDDFRRTVDVTMWGALHLVRSAARRMIDQNVSGSIVVVSSPHAFIPVPRSMAYNMSKGAIDQMARTAAIELVEHRIRVNMVHPGWIDTPGERKFFSEEQIQKAAKALPWERLGSPEEVARGVVFLCDPDSDYMTGSSLLIDGGITLPWWANRGSAVPE